MVAGLVTDPFGAPNGIRVLTVPTIERIGPGKVGAPTELDLVITPTVPGSAVPLTHTLTAFTPAPSAMWLLVSIQAELTPFMPTAPTFSPGSVIHLLPSALFTVIEVPFAGNTGMVTLDPTPVAFGLRGLEWHVQGFSYDAALGQYATSDGFLIVVN
jgi:hypothetical protein